MARKSRSSIKMKLKLTRRDLALTNLDLAYARAVCPPGCTVSDHALLVGLHKARYECTTVSDHLRHASRAWLEERSYQRYRGLPWPPEGELPVRPPMA